MKGVANGIELTSPGGERNEKSDSGDSVKSPR